MLLLAKVTHSESPSVNDRTMDPGSGLELTTFGSEDKWLTPSSLSSSKHGRHGRKLSKLCKYFFSCVEIFHLWCRNFSFHYYPTIGAKNFHTREENFPHQRQNKFSSPKTTNFHTIDKKFPHQRQNISTTEQNSYKRNICCNYNNFYCTS